MTEFKIKPELFFYAFRYALGRKTWVPGEVARMITANIDLMPVEICKQMIKEITEAETAKRLGMDVDAITWKDLREVLKGRTG